MSSPAVHVFVTLGTDHHRFDRLITWVDLWTPPAGVAVDILVQHGATRPPQAGRGVPYLDTEALREVLAESDVVVAQGGPGGIMDARRAGRVPIVVPRRAALDEVVDDHQVAFARRLARAGTVRVVETCEQLHLQLDQAVQDPDAVRCPPLADTAVAAARAVERVVDGVVAARRDHTGFRFRERLPSVGSLRSTSGRRPPPGA
jgi:UDP-N-acetylglucosamine transferase subunit ALG13